ncbi:MAG: amidohydrolase family protein [Roseivirga sp.]|nr:amidohydrolase family protein [Roseivirga sp.]
MKFITTLFLLSITLSVMGQQRVITNTHVVDVSRGQLIENRDVYITEGKISAIKKHKPQITYSGMEVTDGTDKYLIPGLIDSHVHVAIGPVKVRMDDQTPVIYLELEKEYAERTANLLIAYGVTTARDPGGLTEVTVGTKKAIARGEILGPEFSVAGSILDTLAFENLTTTVKNKAEILAEVKRQKAAGVDWVKLYTSLSPELLKAGIDAARDNGLKSVSHLHTTSWTEAARLGLDNIVHIIPGSNKLLPEAKRSEYEKFEALGAIAFYKWFEYVDLDSPEIADMLEAMSKNKVTLDPTLVPFHAAFFGNKNIYQSKAELQYMPEAMTNNWKTTFNFNLGWKEHDFTAAQAVWPKVEKLVRMLHEKGIMMTTGTDANNPWVVPGSSLHDELEVLVKCGLTSTEVLKMATIHGAKLIGMEKRVGQVKKGFEADLVLLNGNPFEDIANTKNIETVFVNGKPVNSKAVLEKLKR